MDLVDNMSPEEKSNVARGYKATISNPSTLLLTLLLYYPYLFFL